MSNQPTPAADAIIVRQENIATIAQAGPQSYRDNVVSCQRCSDAGQQLLDEVLRDGMSDDLDRRIAAYIEKSRKTLRVMNERRSPVTKLFDQVRAEFTALENAVDPTKKDTLPWQLARHRDAYAAKKHEEGERRRQAELAAQEQIKAKESCRVAIEEDYRIMFNGLINRSINELTELNTRVTLDNYTAVFDTVSGYTTTLDAKWRPTPSVRRPFNLSPAEAETICNEAFSKLRPAFEQQYEFEVGEYRREILDKLPSKKAELERMAAASAAEAAAMKEQLARREAEDAARKEQERRQAELDARQKAELDKANAEVSGLFALAKADQQEYTPKTKVSKKIKIHEAAGFLAIVSMWWQREGNGMSIDDLAKIFKKQVTFCERLANKEGVLVESAALEYVDDVKAQ